MLYTKVYLLLLSMHFLMICFVTMSLNSKDKLNIPCMDYTAISSMVITPIYGWKSYYLLVWWSYRFGMKFKLFFFLVWNSYRCFCCVHLTAVRVGIQNTPPLTTSSRYNKAMVPNTAHTSLHWVLAASLCILHIHTTEYAWHLTGYLPRLQWQWRQSCHQGESCLLPAWTRPILWSPWQFLWSSMCVSLVCANSIHAHTHRHARTNHWTIK